MKKGMLTIGVVKAVCCAAVFIGFSLNVAAGPPKNVVVTSIVRDNAANIAPRLDIQSDGVESYLNSKTLTSQIQAIGDWELDARNPKRRHAADLRGFQPADRRQRPRRRESDQSALRQLQVPRNGPVQPVRQQPPRLFGGRHEDVPVTRGHRLRRDDVGVGDGSV